MGLMDKEECQKQFMPKNFLEADYRMSADFPELEELPTLFRVVRLPCPALPTPFFCFYWP